MFDTRGCPGEGLRRGRCGFSWGWRRGRWRVLKNMNSRQQS